MPRSGADAAGPEPVGGTMMDDLMQRYSTVANMAHDSHMKGYQQCKDDLLTVISKASKPCTKDDELCEVIANAVLDFLKRYP